MFISEFLSRLPAFACALGLTSAIVSMSTKSTEAQTMKALVGFQGGGSGGVALKRGL